MAERSLTVTDASRLTVAAGLAGLLQAACKAQRWRRFSELDAMLSLGRQVRKARSGYGQLARRLQIIASVSEASALLPRRLAAFKHIQAPKQ